MPSASANNSSVGVGPPAGGGTGPPPDVPSATLRSVGVSRRATHARATAPARPQSQRPAGRRERPQLAPAPRRHRSARQMPPHARRLPPRPPSQRPGPRSWPQANLQSLSRRVRQEQRRLRRPVRGTRQRSVPPTSYKAETHRTRQRSVPPNATHNEGQRQQRHRECCLATLAPRSAPRVRRQHRDSRSGPWGTTECNCGHRGDATPAS